MKNTGRNLSQSTFISRIINSDIGRAQGHCLHYCHSSEMDRGIDDFVDPCSTELWDVMEGGDHWDHWDDDDHHWEDNDHHWDHNDHDWNQNFAFAGLGCKQSKDTQE